MAVFQRLFGRPRGSSPEHTEVQEENFSPEGFVVYGQSSFTSSLSKSTSESRDIPKPRGPERQESVQSLSNIFPTHMFKLNKHLEVTKTDDSMTLFTINEKLKQIGDYLDSTDMLFSFKLEEQVLSEYEAADCVSTSFGDLELQPQPFSQYSLWNNLH